MKHVDKMPIAKDDTSSAGNEGIPRCKEGIASCNLEDIADSISKAAGDLREATSKGMTGIDFSNIANRIKNAAHNIHCCEGEGCDGCDFNKLAENLHKVSIMIHDTAKEKIKNMNFDNVADNLSQAAQKLKGAINERMPDLTPIKDRFNDAADKLKDAVREHVSDIFPHHTHNEKKTKPNLEALARVQEDENGDTYLYKFFNNAINWKYEKINLKYKYPNITIKGTIEDTYWNIFKEHNLLNEEGNLSWDKIESAIKHTPYYQEKDSED